MVVSACSRAGSTTSKTWNSTSSPMTARRLRSESRSQAAQRTRRDAKGTGSPEGSATLQWMSAECGDHGSRRNESGTGTSRRSLAPRIGASPVSDQTGNTVRCETSLRSRVEVARMPEAKASVSASAVIVLPRNMPWGSAKTMRTVSSPSALTAATVSAARATASPESAPERASAPARILSSTPPIPAPAFR